MARKFTKRDSNDAELRDAPSRGGRSRPVFRYSEASKEARSAAHIDSAQGAPVVEKESSESVAFADEPAGTEASVPRAGARNARKLGMRILGLVFMVLVALMLVFAGYYGANRWALHNDAASIEGQWRVVGTTNPITITSDTIQLNSDTVYEYTIDTRVKTITYRFGELEGQSHYRFVDKQRILVLTDGSHFTMLSTLLDDLHYDINDAIDIIRGSGEIRVPSGEGVIVLERI